MILKYPSRIALAALIAAAAGGCSNPVPDELATDPGAHAEFDRPKLGLMTSLPLYWPLSAEFGDLAQGKAEKPWQRVLMEREVDLVPLDTLSPIPGLSPEDTDTDPLAGLTQLAVIQPRGLSPADNLALDQWVRAGGHLLIVLDPMLTGEYDVPLGDPRRPNDTALVPPVIPRWGVVGAFSPGNTDVRLVGLPGGELPVWMGSELRGLAVESGVNGCKVHDSKLISRCDGIGEGRVTFVGDAAVFEHRELAGDDGQAIKALMDYAFK